MDMKKRINGLEKQLEKLTTIVEGCVKGLRLVSDNTASVCKLGQDTAKANAILFDQISELKRFCERAFVILAERAGLEGESFVRKVLLEVRKDNE